MLQNKGFTALCCLFGIGTIRSIYASQWNWVITDVFMGIAITLFGFGLFIAATVRVFQRNYPPRHQQFIPLYIWLGTVTLCLGYNEWVNRLDNEPTWLRISNGGGVGSVSFDFKKNGQYCYWDGSPFGVSRGYGRYSRRDSLIWLYPLPSPEPTNTQERLLVIRPFSLAKGLGFDTMATVVPLDSAGKAIRNQIYYITDLN